MNDNKFTESMEVIEIGTMRLCDSVPVCANFTDVTGVLIEGITKEAAKLLYEKVEVVPVGTKEKMAELEASNKQLREIICEYGLNIADQDYLLRPDTISRTIDIMVEEKGKDGWYGNKLKENQKARGLQQ